MRRESENWPSLFIDSFFGGSKISLEHQTLAPSISSQRSCPHYHFLITGPGASTLNVEGVPWLRNSCRMIHEAIIGTAQDENNGTTIKIVF